MKKGRHLFTAFLLLTLWGELGTGYATAQFDQGLKRTTEPQPDERTRAFLMEYGCSVVKVLLKHVPKNLLPGEYSEDVENFTATGFYIDAAGDIVTATHTFFFVTPVDDKSVQEQTIVNSDGSSEPFFDVSSDEIERGRLSDILVLHTGQKPPCYLTLASSTKLKMGQELFPIGFPSSHNDYYILNGLRHQRPLAQRGFLRRRIEGKYGPLIDVEMYGDHGSSGSPLISAEGKVIGVLSQTVRDGAGVLVSPIETSPALADEAVAAGSPRTTPSKPKAGAPFIVVSPR